MHLTAADAGEHLDVTRRYFLRLGAAGAMALAARPLWAQDLTPDAGLAAAIGRLEYLTPPDDFGTVEPGKLADLIVVRGNPLFDIQSLANVEVVVKGGMLLKRAPGG